MASWALSLVVSHGVAAVTTPPLSLPPSAPQTSAISGGPTPDRPAAAAAAAAAEAPLMFYNRPLLVFRTSYLGMTPAERARRSLLNIEDALDRGGPGTVTVKGAPQGRLLFVDGLMAIILFEGDVDPLSGDTLEVLADRTAWALQRGIAERSEDGSTRHLLVNLGTVALASALAFGLYLALSWGQARAMAALQRFAERQAARLGGAAEVLRRERLHQVLTLVDTLLSWSWGVLLAYSWLSYVLLRFAYTRPWGEGLHEYLISVASHLAHAIVGALPGLLVAVVILMLARGAAGVVASLFSRIERGHVHVSWASAETAGPTRRVATWLIWLFAVAMAYPYLPGAQTEAFKGMSVLIGLMMSLGASSLVGQVAGGLILTYSGMLRKGEYVRIGDHEGTVVSIGAFSTRIRTGLGEEVVLPNAMIVGSATKNYSRTVKGDGYVVDTVVTIGYDTPWRQVHAMLVEAARRTHGVLGDPAPRVFQTALTDFYPEYRLVCQAVPTEPRPRADVLAQLHANIQDVFNEHGVQIMSPHYAFDPQNEKTVPRERWFMPPATPAAQATSADAPDAPPAV